LKTKEQIHEHIKRTAYGLLAESTLEESVHGSSYWRLTAYKEPKKDLILDVGGQQVICAGTRYIEASVWGDDDNYLTVFTLGCDRKLFSLRNVSLPWSESPWRGDNFVAGLTAADACIWWNDRPCAYFTLRTYHHPVDVYELMDNVTQVRIFGYWKEFADFANK